MLLLLLLGLRLRLIAGIARGSQLPGIQDCSSGTATLAALQAVVLMMLMVVLMVVRVLVVVRMQVVVMELMMMMMMGGC